MTRDDIQALLPFLANDTLTGDERAEVEAAVAKDAELQGELSALKAIRETMQAEEMYSPGEMGLAKLMRDVEAEAEAPAPRASQPLRRPVLWQVAAAILLAVVLGQAVFLTQGGDPNTGGFELAGTEAAFEITIAPDAPESAIRDLLLEAGVEIVAGPSALGVYQLNPIEGVTEDEARGILSVSDLIESLSEPVE
ncbi:hypothetical protein AIOL_003981 [Candidatus Rhodobacter oscarellae]|uniref:Zinc-finger domain-containing protein n=1 Tax=Candidatus Rhodobacter oscarellae TaxID=1675527 RepID=A0A0J9E8D0_9RHOB|nr:hypothetical protein [Candidatus Rhodobacter lobularis]KMW59000.1 hypothetical protein AIOL_003981 [Candidatus Rhodobacter lobularis]